MSLKNGLKKRTPPSCWLMIVTLAFVVLPGAVAQTSSEEAASSVGQAFSLPSSGKASTETVSGNQVIDQTAVSADGADLTAGIRLDDSFVLSAEMPLTGSTVIAFVNEKPITVDDMLKSLRRRLEQDAPVTGKQRRTLLLAAIESGLPHFIFEEVVLQSFRHNTPERRQIQIRDSLEPRFSEQLEIIKKHEHLANDAELELRLADEETSIATLRENFVRMQIALGYVNSFPDTQRVRWKNAILDRGRQLLLEARLRKRVSLTFENTDLEDVLREIATDHGISISYCKTESQIGSVVHDRPTTVTVRIQNQPLKDALKEILEPLGLRHDISFETIRIRLADNSTDIAKPSPLWLPSHLDNPDGDLNRYLQDADIIDGDRSLLTVVSYAVADLVVTQEAPFTGVPLSAAAATQPIKSVAPAADTAPNPWPAHAVAQYWLPQAGSNNIDFVPLVELIKASVAPESWEHDAAIATDDKSLALVIRQTQAVHDEIAEVLSTLRSASETQILLTCRLVQVDSRESQTWIDNNVTLHKSSSGARWSLLTAKKTAALSQQYLQPGITTLSAPCMLTIDGQTVQMSLQSDVPDGFNFGLFATPRVIAGDRFLILEYGWTFDSDQVAAIAMNRPNSHKATLESGQTLLLDVTDSATAKTPTSADMVPRTFLQITAERLRKEP